MLEQDTVAAHALEPSLRTPHPNQAAWDAYLKHWPRRRCLPNSTACSSNAIALWEEARQFRSVTANLFLYNMIISKLWKARKADCVLGLFQQMKANFIHPSTVTYGAVIAVCCCVSDAQSAEILFEEMTAKKNSS